MMEGGKTEEISEMDKQVKNEFRNMVQQKLIDDPSSVIRPLEYKPGQRVLVSLGEEEYIEATVKEGKAGIYIVYLKDKEGAFMPMICTENRMFPFN